MGIYRTLVFVIWVGSHDVSFVILMLVAASKLGCDCSVQRSGDSLNGILGSLLVPQTGLRRFDGLAGLPSRLGCSDVFAEGIGCPLASPMGWAAFAESFGWSCGLVVRGLGGVVCSLLGG